MQIFNLGFGEILFIILIAVIVLGPERIVASSRRSGRWIRAVTSNRMWHEIVATSHELREIPNQLMVESGLREDFSNIQTGISSFNRETSTELAESIDKVQIDAPSYQPFRSEKLIEPLASVISDEENVTG